MMSGMVEAARRPARVWLVANPASGSTDAGQVAAVRAQLGAAGADILGETRFSDEDLPLAAALEAGAIDTLIIFGGDGTINAVVAAVGDWAGQCLVLPGGTMNKLALALHGETARETILGRIATARLVRLPAADAGGHRALVGIILGPAAAWVHAREGVRKRRFWRAVRAAQVALARSFGGGISVVGTPGRHRAVVVTPDADGLEVAMIDAAGVGDAMRIGWSWLSGDWRDSQLVEAGRAAEVTLAGRRRVRALFDGEPAMLASPVTVRHSMTSLHFVATAGAA